MIVLVCHISKQRRTGIYYFTVMITMDTKKIRQYQKSIAPHIDVHMHIVQIKY